MDMTEMRAVMRRVNELTVSEIFGPTLQGEGRSQGKPVTFLRLGLCNLDCAWCDTPYTWDWQGKNGTAYDRKEQLRTMTVDEVFTLIPEQPNRLVITGGEPMVQQRKLLLLIQALRYRNEYFNIEIETNGTIAPLPDFDMLNVQFNVSPKLPNSGVAQSKAIKPDILQQYKDLGCVFKFVVETDRCIEQVQTLQKELRISNPRVWLMPQGRTTTDILGQLPWLFDRCSEYGYNLSPRLHVLAHNDKRGV